MKIYLIGLALCLGAAAACFDTAGQCGDLGPPPSILEMPPPPMPSFIAAVLEDQLGNNESNSPHSDILIETNELEPGKPCKSMCDVDQGVGFVELPQHGPIIEGYSFWMFVSTCLLGVMLLGTIILVVIMRLKDKKRWSKSDFSPEPKKSPNLYDTIDISPKTFWATLSPTGNIDTTATVRRPVHHHPQTIANPNFENGAYYPYDQQHIYQQIDTIRRIPEYQTIRPRVSSPTRIEHPNMPPLNLYRSIRRVSDLESP